MNKLRTFLCALFSMSLLLLSVKSFATHPHEPEEPVSKYLYDCSNADNIYSGNAMTVEETVEQLVFSLKGSPISWKSQNQEFINFSIDKDKCSFSKDKKLISCNEANVRVTRKNMYSSLATITRYNHLGVEIRYVTYLRYTGEEKSGFELHISLRNSISSGVSDRYSKVTLFPGTRSSGCTDNSNL